MHLYICIYTHTFILSHILFHYDLLQDIEYSQLCYTVVPCCYPFCVQQFASAKSQIPNYLSLTPWQAQVYSLSICFCFVDKSIYVIFLDSHRSDTHLSFCLTHFTQYDSLFKSIHAAVNSIISFLMAEQYSII